jgi:hypothetical protein
VELPKINSPTVQKISRRREDLARPPLVVHIAQLNPHNRKKGLYLGVRRQRHRMTELGSSSKSSRKAIRGCTKKNELFEENYFIAATSW